MRKKYSGRFLPVVLAACCSLPASAQSPYDPHAAFAPLFYKARGNAFRNADGSPGASYWQNRADYQVNAMLDTAADMIRGDVEITYVNNSPGTLSFVWLQLDQNIDRNDSRARTMEKPGEQETGGNGYHLSEVSLLENGKWEPAAYIVNDTRMQIRLPEPLAAAGGTLRLRIRYDYQLVASGGGGRSGYMGVQQGRIYEVSYWYPRLCVYDDLHGWNVLPFLGGGEFYLDYGDIDYKV